MESKSRGRRNGLRSAHAASRTHVATAGKPRTRDHNSSALGLLTPAVAGPDADHPPPAANPHFSAGRFHRDSSSRGAWEQGGQ